LLRGAEDQNEYSIQLYFHQAQRLLLLETCSRRPTTPL